MVRLGSEPDRYIHTYIHTIARRSRFTTIYRSLPSRAATRRNWAQHPIFLLFYFLLVRATLVASLRSRCAFHTFAILRRFDTEFSFVSPIRRQTTSRRSVAVTSMLHVVYHRACLLPPLFPASTTCLFSGCLVLPTCYAFPPIYLIE